MNAWALFDEVGTSYANRAVRSGEYPSLYRLSIPGREFEPYLAEGMPSAVTPDGSSFTATVKLRPSLYWSDGSPLTSLDVAFTASTALAFRLGLDWASAYNSDLLERAEAVDNATLRFVFKAPINVGDWQYGVLQGPILSRAYWSAKLAEAEALLPSADLVAQVDETRLETAAVQAQIEADSALLRLTAPNSENYNDVASRLNRNQNELNSLNTRSAKLQDEYDAALNAARAALFSLTDEGEPVFGPFLRFTHTGNLYTRAANPSHPFTKPQFESILYAVYPDAASAMEAMLKGLVDLILDPRGFPAGSIPAAQQDPSVTLVSNATRSAHFLVFNPANAVVSDPALRLALNCMIDTGELPFDSFVLPENGSWFNPAAGPSCPQGTGFSAAVQVLKAAGYRWSREPVVDPVTDQPGEGMTRPEGAPFPPLTLLTVSQNAAPADVVTTSLRFLGVPVSVRSVSAEDLRYAVYSTGDYDLALLGWSLSDYPGYLCEWFESPGPFAMPGAGLEEACRILDTSTDLETSRQAVYHIQSVLMRDLPFIPLYQGVIDEAYRGLAYPFQFVPGGLAGLYGAPDLASPAP